MNKSNKDRCLVSLFTILQLCSFNSIAGSRSYEVEEGILECFKARGLNYVIWQNTDDDEDAMEAHYSFRYRLFDCQKDEETVEGESAVDESKFYVDFSYTGEFDFYLGTRSSGPVINRLSNPAFHFIWEYYQSNVINYFDIGLEHRSNGQVTDADEFIGVPGTSTFRYRTQLAYENNDHEYFDTISRSANYISFVAGNNSSEDYKWSVGYKYYINDESNITWGGLAGSDVNVEDYDLINLDFSTKLFGDTALSVSYLLGRELFSTDSIDIGLYIPPNSDDGGWNVPFYIRAHFGPMERLSDYTKSSYSIGVGVIFNL